MSHNPTPPRRRIDWFAVFTRISAFLVAAVAGASSYEHIASVALAAGERAWVAYTLPLAIDGMIVVGVLSLIEDKRQGLIPRMSARVAVVVGVAATLAANLESAEPFLTPRLVALAAPGVFLIVVEVLTRKGRSPKDAPAAAVSAPPAPAPVPDVEIPDDISGLDTAPDVEIPDDISGLDPEPAAEPELVDRRSRRKRRRGSRARERALAALAKAPTASTGELARLADVSRNTARKYRQQANGAGPAPA